jgi:hypothetical protein
MLLPSWLKYRRTILLLSLLLVAPFRATANGRDWCGPNGRGESRRVKGFIVQLVPLQSEDDAVDVRCRVIVRVRDGRVAFARSGHQITILDITGEDVNGDGRPDAVFEDYSGGAHCCWTYWIASLGDSPKLVREIENDREVVFSKDEHDGKVTINTLDGAFDGFAELSHADSPFPAVYLRLEGRDLKRVDGEFWPQYAAEIREARSRLHNDDLAAFRKQGPITVKLDFSVEAGEVHTLTKTETNVLLIVLAYLYAGKTQTAWTELHKYWPPGDEQRIRKEILATARSGFLGDPASPKYGVHE